MDTHTCAAARVPVPSLDLSHDGTVFLDSVTDVEVDGDGLYLIGYRLGVWTYEWLPAGEVISYVGQHPRPHPRV